MPIKVIKDSFEYCTANKAFFLFVLFLIFVCNFLTVMFDSHFIGPIVMTLIMTGYGLQVTQDIISGGTRLPKISPKKIIVLGIKGTVIFVFYGFIQIFLLAFISDMLKFPVFEIEELIMNYNETIHLFMTHEPVSFVIFVISGLILVYVTVFFMELALAKLAESGKLRNAFRFFKIRQAIDIIGWREYAIDYSKIILSIVVLTFLLRYEIPVNIIDSSIDAVLSFMIFIIEYVGIGRIYREYLIKKSKIVE